MDLRRGGIITKLENGLFMKNIYENEEGYCRKLGHHLTFGYCPTERNGLPCAKIRDCWFAKIPIDTFLQENFSPEEIAYLYEPPPHKMSTLLALIERSQKLAQEK